jgi:hypothetical protein
MFPILMNSLAILAIFTCGLTLILSIWPGVLQGFAVFIGMGLLWLGVIAAIAIAGLTLWFRRSQPATRSALRRFISVLLLLAVSYGLLKFYVPRRIAFHLARPAFERRLVEHPAKPGQRPAFEPEYAQPADKVSWVNAKFGLYDVEQHIADKRGGNYFRVHRHGDGLGPSEVSYGFVKHPNQTGSPFGDAYYQIFPLEEQWYWFEASTDW